MAGLAVHLGPSEAFMFPEMNEVKEGPPHINSRDERSEGGTTTH